MKTNMKFPQKTKNRATIKSRNPTPGHLSGKEENSNSKRHMHPNVHHGTVYNSQDMETIEVSMDRWMDKGVFHVHNGMLLSRKKEWYVAICSYMDGPRDYHTM